MIEMNITIKQTIIMKVIETYLFLIFILFTYILELLTLSNELLF